MNRTQCRTAADDILLDPLLVPTAGSAKEVSRERRTGFVVGAYCIEDEVILRRELDFAAECRNAERIAANFANDPQILIPAVHWEWTCESLNVQDFVDGIPGRDLVAVDAAGLDRKALARTGAGIVVDSDPDKELDETRAKARGLLRALGQQG